jgi:hypothetical protein
MLTQKTVSFAPLSPLLFALCAHLPLANDHSFRSYPVKEVFPPAETRSYRPPGRPARPGSESGGRMPRWIRKEISYLNCELRALETFALWLKEEETDARN